MCVMKVKSLIVNPVTDVRSGPVQIYGVAFAGVNPLEKVEVSTDGGQTWQQAQLTGPDLGPFGWRVFVLPAELQSGSHTITSRWRRTRVAMSSQRLRKPNQRGYDYSGWRKLPSQSRRLDAYC